MLSFDIETTGLSFVNDKITCACVYDGDLHIEKQYVFANGDNPEDFLQMLDEASNLCAFNGARFDIPFIQTQWNIEESRARKWKLKLFDIYEFSVQVFSKGFSLNQLLSVNQIAFKTADGKQAIQFAAASNWKALGDYCMDDTKKTYLVSTLPVIMLPKHLAMDSTLSLHQDRNEQTLWVVVTNSS
jgi:DNA polymerase III alpha subunit (gram-positive type)